MGNKDYLDREEFVDNLISYIDFNEKKTIAIDGHWGIGKTFVVEYLCERLLKKNEKIEKKYLPIVINAWKYDYYDEPLEALLLAIYDEIFPKYEQIVSKNSVKIIGTGIEILKCLAINSIKNKTGIDLSNINNTVVKKMKKMGLSVPDKGELNSKSILSSTLEISQSVLNKMSKDNKLVIIIDELDRCLPEQAIKYFERIHHIFDSVEGVTVVFSIDKTQISNTIEKIFGWNNENTTKYFKKFIDIDFKLGFGDLTVGFRDQYEDYYNCFNHEKEECDLILTFMIANLFDKNIRDIKKKINKAYSLHKLVSNKLVNRPLDNSLLVAEVLYLIISDKHDAKMRLLRMQHRSIDEKLENFYVNYLFSTLKETEIRYTESPRYLTAEELISNTCYVLRESIIHKVLTLFLENEWELLYDENLMNQFRPYIIENADIINEELAVFNDFLRIYNETNNY